MRQKLGLTLKEKRRFWYSMFIGVIMICGSIWFINYNKQNKKALIQHGEYTIATTLKEVWRVKRGKTDVQYYFFVKGKKYISWEKIPVVNGSHIEVKVPGGKYMVKYLPENPEISEIDFNKPDTTNAEYYFNKSKNVENVTTKISFLNKAIELNPDYSEAYYYRGWLKNRLQRSFPPTAGCADICKAYELGYPKQEPRFMKTCDCNLL